MMPKCKPTGAGHETPVVAGARRMQPPKPEAVDGQPSQRTFGAMSAFPGPARSLLGPLALPTNVSDGEPRRAKTLRIRRRNDGNITVRPHSAPIRSARFKPFRSARFLSARPSAQRSAQPTTSRPEPQAGGGPPGTASRCRQLSLAVHTRLSFSSVITTSNVDMVRPLCASVATPVTRPDLTAR